MYTEIIINSCDFNILKRKNHDIAEARQYTVVARFKIHTPTTFIMDESYSIFVPKLSTKFSFNLVSVVHEATGTRRPIIIRNMTNRSNRWTHDIAKQKR